MSNFVFPIAFAALFVSMSLPFFAHFVMKKDSARAKKLLIANIGSFMVVMVSTIVLFSSGSVFAETAGTATNSNAGLGYIAAALSTGLACIASGLAVAASASSAIGAISENPKVMGRALIFVAMAEGISLFGFLVSFMILGKIQ